MNKVILIGNLARAPELRTTANGVSVCNLTIAVNRRYLNPQGVREADFLLRPACLYHQPAAEEALVVDGQIILLLAKVVQEFWHKYGGKIL